MSRSAPGAFCHHAPTRRKSSLPLLYCRRQRRRRLRRNMASLACASTASAPDAARHACSPTPAFLGRHESRRRQVRRDSPPAAFRRRSAVPRRSFPPCESRFARGVKMVDRPSARAAGSVFVFGQIDSDSPFGGCRYSFDFRDWPAPVSFNAYAELLCYTGFRSSPRRKVATRDSGDEASSSGCHHSPSGAHRRHADQMFSAHNA